MWLVYPIDEDDIRDTKRGILVLLSASALWYSTLAVALMLWDNVLLMKVRNKFTMVSEGEKNWTPFIVLLGAFVAAGLLRMLGYRLTRNVGGACAAGDGVHIAILGAGLWLAASGTVYIGFTGLLAVVTALGTVMELRFLRFPASLFGMVVSQEAVRRVGWYFYARMAWLIVVILAALVLLGAHVAMDIPRKADGPVEQSVARVTAVLKPVFNILAGLAVITLPLLTAAYWAILYGIHQTVGRLRDPNGPVVTPEAPVKAGFDQLKSVLKQPEW
ncbi:hypothetical protein [Fimbriiglobus ruber]|uniref:Uncharacterized protein n=1 Tax=Fimbriiglobus ruber TaxID=1908690 RepID=A0A225DQM5_9BACT|nr:hypothetical protein [Fimbriiglobus ruber]OWK43770.1 hypothetical protein FRUB_03369 [Fimbriiglobus ruber]